MWKWRVGGVEGEKEEKEKEREVWFLEDSDCVGNDDEEEKEEEERGMLTGRKRARLELGGKRWSNKMRVKRREVERLPHRCDLRPATPPQNHHTTTHHTPYSITFHTTLRHLASLDLLLPPHSLRLHHILRFYTAHITITHHIVHHIPPF
ncbi:hypothetical protein E2C01_063602 [Portunus trituberculatus]|uniref:Uncharacterized protein n=1 Tax=Portunus trituberculatus TaxID=210409 RepID=A0A5B7HI25_PORTR|nr:hypothetical protein [Portunus trituberculatus]